MTKVKKHYDVVPSNIVPSGAVVRWGGVNDQGRKYWVEPLRVYHDRSISEVESSIFSEVDAFSNFSVIKIKIDLGYGWKYVGTYRYISQKWTRISVSNPNKPLCMGAMAAVCVIALFLIMVLMIKR